MFKPKLSNPNKKYHQGRYIPKNPTKYIGNPANIVYRSAWEKQFLKWCDTNSMIVKYGSEEMVVEYLSPLDNCTHRYFIDFVIYVKQPDGDIKKFAIEIKPYSQTKPPRLPRGKMINESYQWAVNTYLVNRAKWQAASKVCERLGMKFVLLTEKQLFKKK